MKIKPIYVINESDGETMKNSRSISDFIFKHKFGTILFIVFILSVLVFYYVFFSNKKILPEINMNDTVKKSEIKGDKNSTKELNIAIGAMISPEITRDFYEELMSVIANKLDMKVRFFQQRTYEEVNNLVKNKNVDIAYVCSGPYTKGYEEFGMEILVVPVVNGKKVYHSYIIANKDSKIRTFQDLRGKKFAFSDPNSNTGCLVPIYMLSKIGKTPKSFFRETFFTYSHDNSIRSVAENQSDGAAVDGIIWEFFNSVDPSITSQTKIIEKSPPYGIPPFVVHPNLDKKIKDKLKKIFLSLHLDKKAKLLLDKIHIDRFEPGDHSMYDSVNEMRTWIKENK